MTNPMDGPASAPTAQPSSPASAVPPDALQKGPPASPPPAAPLKTAAGFNEQGKVGRTRVSGVWIGLIAGALFLILLIIFIAQNSSKATVHFLGWHGRFSIGLTILLSAVIGILLVAVPGTVRILQLRRALRKNIPSGKVRKTK